MSLVVLCQKPLGELSFQFGLSLLYFSLLFLDKIGDQAAIHTITRVLRDVVEDVQWSVRQSMRKLKGARA